MVKPCITDAGRRAHDNDKRRYFQKALQRGTFFIQCPPGIQRVQKLFHQFPESPIATRFQQLPDGRAIRAQPLNGKSHSVFLQFVVILVRFVVLLIPLRNDFTQMYFRSDGIRIQIAARRIKLEQARYPHGISASRGNGTGV